jgi:hypothetical protein
MYDPTQARTGPCPEQYRSNTCLETRFSLAEIIIFKFPSRITSISKPRALFPWGVSSARPPTYPRSMMYVFKKIYHPQFSAGHDQSFAPFFSLLSIRNLVRTEIFSRNHKSLRFKLVFRHSNARINMNTNVKTSRTPRSRPRKKGNIVDDLSACKITSPSFSPTQKRKLLPEDGDATGKAGKTPRSETTSIHEGERKINYEIFSCFFAINGCHLSRKFYLRLINVLDNDLMEFDDADDQWSPLTRTPLMNGSARSHRKPIRKPRSAGRRHRTLSSGNINMNLDSLNYVYNVVNYRDIVVNYCDEAPRGCTELKILNKKFGGKLRRDVLNCVAILTDAEGREIGEVNEMNEKIHAVYVGVRGIEGFHPKDYG